MSTSQGLAKFLNTEKQMTLAHIGQAFASIAGTVVLSLNKEGDQKSKLFRTPLPCIMQHTVFTALIPKNRHFSKVLRDIALIIETEMAILTANPRDKREMLVKPFESLIDEYQPHVDHLIAVSITPECKQLEILLKGGVLVMGTNTYAEYFLSPRVRALAAELTKIREVQMLTYLQACNRIAQKTATQSTSRQTQEN